jgi:hypothetical protein
MTRFPSWAWIAAAGATTSRRRARWVRKISTMSGRVAWRVPGITGGEVSTLIRPSFRMLAGRANGRPAVSAVAPRRPGPGNQAAQAAKMFPGRSPH